MKYSKNFYQIKSNKESGEGRYEIMLIPHNKTQNGVVIEIKQIPKQQKNETAEDFIKRRTDFWLINQLDAEKTEIIINFIENKKNVE